MDLRRFRIISDVIDKRLTQTEAAELLGMSVRQLRRIYVRVKVRGMDGVVHGGVGKPSNHRIDPNLETKVLELWNAKYRAAGFNFQHFTEKLKECEGLTVSKEKIRTLQKDWRIDQRRRPCQHAVGRFPPKSL